MLQIIFAIVAVVLGIGMCVGVIYLLITGDDDRVKEEEAREYFDRHGHWPDETPT
jgi:hypothetical protein